ncbi:transmembrane protein, putative (macronuclear) [Tetrahymena thermophila SB210]|uniref:Transmembrane protein, putative n=1 Tax=Tetrahymena thermophila (strain SB210) TaxID=312017 RepID=I7MMJ2_TETTS|nr:transmembrane protein, putative [Tetrahymena thermophila SB210]EAS04962.2 transmembrane protein, putative [Tetrahymena thermophila SB210]|eukprot:XP_001025207.2 transmembrane protein, putative [Tetrahymena thermophila SB210]
MFKQSIVRNVIGTVSSFPIHYYLDPTMTSYMLMGVGIVQFYSIYKYKQSTKITGYYKDQKHLLQSLQQNNFEQQFSNQNSQYQQSEYQELFSKHSENLQSSKEQGLSNYEKYLKESQSNNNSNINNQFSGQFNDQVQAKDDQIRYIEVENTNERLTYYNSQLMCMGLLQGVLLGSYMEIWNDGYIYLIQLSTFLNSVLNGYLFHYFYKTNYKMTNLKALLIGSITPLPITIMAPIVYNNGLIQSNLFQYAQKLFLSENINQDPSLFFTYRMGIRLFGLLFLYFIGFLILSGDQDVEDDDEEESSSENEKDKNVFDIFIKIKFDDKNQNKNLNIDNTNKNSQTENQQIDKTNKQNEKDQ